MNPPSPEEWPIYTEMFFGVRLATLYQFQSGLFMGLSVVVALFFTRFWKKTQDRFFGLFGLAFWLIAFERAALLFFSVRHEAHTLVYTIRLAAFCIIIWAIIDKNRGNGR